MADVLIIGDGPGGLSAALLLAKNGLETVVLGMDGTPMHKAKLFNYLGIDEIDGSEFQRRAREQVRRHGATVQQGEVTELSQAGDGFDAVTAEGQQYHGKYLILAVGTKRDIAKGLGVATDSDGVVEVDRDGRTSVNNCYALGWTTKKHKTQAIISAGHGASAALDILSQEKGKEFHDFDVVEASGS